MGKLGAVIFTVCLSALYGLIIRAAVVTLKKTVEHPFKEAFSEKFTIILSNLAIAGIEFFLWIWFIFSADGSDGNLFHNATKMYVSDFVGYMILLAIIYCLPMLNLLLYRCWYIKASMSRWWVIVPFTLIFGAVSTLMLCGLYGPIGIIRSWLKIEWIFI